jgi:tricorn protease
MNLMFRTASLLLTLSLPAVAIGLEECKLLRQPDIQGDRIVFVYAGDLWTVGRGGGVAARLTAHAGVEIWPKLSPDGRSVAFTGEYDGNLDAFTIPAEGGEPKRLTFHPSPDQVAEWYPDGKALLLRSSRASSIQRYSRFFKIAATDGFEELLPLPQAGYCSFSADGKSLAFVTPSYDNRTWKRYKGGNAPEIWTYDFAANASEKITDWAGSDEWPMWFGNLIYYCSDRDGRRANLWVYDRTTRTHRQVTRFDDYDVRWPSIGTDAIVFEHGGALHVMDLPSERVQSIRVLVPSDKPATRPELRDVSKWIETADLSPGAKRAVFAARGEIFTVPAEHGDVRNLTNTPGARERDPVWSPDGKWIAYLSDASGEYELHVTGSDGKTPERAVTAGGGVYRLRLAWSPDSQKLAFNDKTGALSWCDVAKGKPTRVDKSDHGDIDEFTWSSDSRWLAYAKRFPNQFNRIVLYALDGGTVTVVSSGMHEDFSPSFDPAGKYLYFVSRRTFTPQFGQFEFDFQFQATDRIYAVTLQDTLRTPVPPRSDEEGGEAATAEDEEEEDKKPKSKGKAAGKEKAKDSGALRVDRDGIGARITALPISPGRYGSLVAAEGKLLFAAHSPPDPEDEGEPSVAIHVFGFEEREDEVVAEGVGAGFVTSKDHDQLLVESDGDFYLVEAAADQKLEKKLPVDGLRAWVDPRREWRQMFEEAWRLERDFYYDPNMGGLDWKAVGERYRALVPHVAHRADLTYLLGELIGELGTSHAYVYGGDTPHVELIGTGLLGCDLMLDAASGRYRFSKIYRERDWNSDVRAPLGEPGIDVREGDYLLAVNGRSLRAPENAYAAFVGTVGKQITIRVGATAEDSKARTYTVEPIANETSLRYTDWVQANRAKVDAATGGRIAYIHVPNTATAGIQEFSKQYYPQVDKQGIIVDERFNGGGFVPDFFIERLARRTWVYWSSRDGADFRTPSESIDGPKCIIVNQYAGSGGDAFPFYFRHNGLGPIIGKRTWGGLVGISRNIELMDGGVVTMPDFGMWSAAGWLVENHGVDPDIEVENTPSDMVAGRDAQLERAIQYCVEELAKHPPQRPARPPYKVQVTR